MPKTSEIKVRICNLAGEYLSDDGKSWFFAPNQDHARIFDYHADEVVMQLQQVYRTRGVVLVAVPMDPNLFNETCDVCGTKMHSTEAHFDGTRFLCPACR